jgi:hypothetical protein
MANCRNWPPGACRAATRHRMSPLDPELPHVTVSFGAGILERPRHRDDLLRRPPWRMENVPITLFETKKLSFSGDVLGQLA